jgi:hypothetical protein
MSKRAIVFAFLAFGFFGAQFCGQEVQVRCVPDQGKILFGEPVYARYVLTNVSQAPVFICARLRKDGSLSVVRWKAFASGPFGNVPLRDGVSGDPQFKHLLQSGESVEIHQPLPVTDTTIKELLPGEYQVRFTIEYSLTEQPGTWERRAAGAGNFSVVNPEGPDAAWIKALQEAIRTTGEKSLRRPTREAPIGWYEVLEGPVDGIVPTLIERFPTSKYTGYVLRTSSVSFGCSSYECFDAAEETLRKECDRGGGEANIRVCMEQAREKMRAYIKVAGPFLSAHSDFFDASRIRRLYAYCLAFTGRVDEALDQVCILSKGEGELGKEAKSFLEKRTAKKQTR